MNAPRLPAKCAGRGSNVELAVGVLEPVTHMQQLAGFRKLAPYWAVPLSDESHQCYTQGEKNGGRDAQTSGHPANPDETGADMGKNATPVKHLENRGC